MQDKIKDLILAGETPESIYAAAKDYKKELDKKKKQEKKKQVCGLRDNLIQALVPYVEAMAGSPMTEKEIQVLDKAYDALEDEYIELVEKGNKKAKSSKPGSGHNVLDSDESQRFSEVISLLLNGLE